jgi:hypothetical protein
MHSVVNSNHPNTHWLPSWSAFGMAFWRFVLPTEVDEFLSKDNLFWIVKTNAKDDG